jgi:hypothetical protein
VPTDRKVLAAMRSAVVLALLGLLLVTLQLASASRPLFGIGRGTQKVDGAEVVSQPHTFYDSVICIMQLSLYSMSFIVSLFLGEEGACKDSS